VNLFSTRNPTIETFDRTKDAIVSTFVKDFSSYNLSYDHESNKENGTEEQNEVFPQKRKANMNLSMKNFISSNKNNDDNSSYSSSQRKIVKLEDKPSCDLCDEDVGSVTDHFGEKPSFVDDNSSKKLTSFFNSSGNPSSYISSLFSSPPSLSFVQKSIFKGGIRNLGNSCYMSSVIQSLLVLQEFKKDINSLFWSNILESQLIIQSSPPEVSNEQNNGSGEMPSLLPERVVFRNENSCLSELISLLR
jgi:hypothetical protein